MMIQNNKNEKRKNACYCGSGFHDEPRFFKSYILFISWQKYEFEYKYKNRK